MAQEPYQHWQGEADKGTVVVRDENENEVYVPKKLRAASRFHDYGPTVNARTGERGLGYRDKGPYEHQAYPKMLFHPNWHKEPKPIHNDFKELGQYQAAIQKWERQFERSQVVENEKEEKSLITKGWLMKPPVRDLPKEDPNSTEI